MNAYDLDCFLEAAESLSFTKAAERLYVSQQCISNRIKTLENEYGVTLFTRRPKLALTPDGVYFLEVAREYRQLEQRLRVHLSGVGMEGNVQITLGIPRSRTRIFLPDVLPRIQKLYPRIRINLVEEHTAELEALALNNKVDLFLGVEPEEIPINPTVFQVTPLMHERYYAVISNTMLENNPHVKSILQQSDALRNGIPLAALEGFPMMLNPYANRSHMLICRTFHERGIVPNIVLQCNHSDNVIALCRNNVCIGLVPQMLAMDYMRSHRDALDCINIIPITDCLNNSHVVLACCKTWRKTQPKHIVDFIRITADIFHQYTTDSSNTCHIVYGSGELGK